VWVAGKDDKLKIKQVTVARRTPGEVLISSGLDAGDRVVLTPITGAVEGMKLRVKGGDGEQQGRHMLSRGNHHGAASKEAQD
jgi:hypothetical protein